MIKNLKCTNLATTKVKELVGFEPGHKHFYHKFSTTDYAIEELTARYKMLSLMNYSKWLNTHGTID